MPTVEEMISAAESKATEVNPAGQVPATTSGNAPATARQHRAPSLDDMMNSGMTVENWLKVNENGLVIKTDEGQVLLDNLKVSIDMTEVAATQAVKYGNPPTYHKTFDGQVCADGQTLWSDALEEAQRFGQRPYQSADIPMTLEENVNDKKGKTLMTVGQRIGYSLSTTNRDAFAKFLRAVNGDNLKEATVDVQLGYESKTNKNKQTWGIVTFELEGEKAPE